jgi:flagellar basal body rod protein FlgG
MDALNAAIETAFADARRAATPGAVGSQPDRATTLITASISPDAALATAPSSDPLSIAISGSGMFVFKNGKTIEYGRLGDLRIDEQGYLVDGSGRKILALPARESSPALDRLEPIRIARDRSSGKSATSTYTIDADGYVIRTPLTAAGTPRDAAQKGIRIARIALALFPAPERTLRASDTTVIATKESGSPSVVAPGTANAGTLRSGALECGLVDVQGDLSRVWRLSQQADCRAGMQAAIDACIGTATALIK